MAFETFEQPLYVQRKHYTEEITGLDDVFDFLDEWPQDRRDLAYEVMVDACRKAAGSQLPAQAVADNFRRFLKRHGKLANVKDLHQPPDRGTGSSCRFERNPADHDSHGAA